MRDDGLFFAYQRADITALYSILDRTRATTPCSTMYYVSYGSSKAHRNHYRLYFPRCVCNFRGGKGKLGTQSPPTTNQAGFSPNASPTPPSSGPTASSTPVKETVIHEADSKHMHDRMLFLLSNMIVRTTSLSFSMAFQGYIILLSNAH